MLVEGNIGRGETSPPLNSVLGRFSSCSYYVEKSRKGKTPVSRQSSGGLLPAAPMGDLFIVSVSMIAEKLRLARQSQGYAAPELNRYLTVYFDYSSESDIPTMLTLASRYEKQQTPSIYRIFWSISRISKNKKHQKTYISHIFGEGGDLFYKI